MISRIPGLPFVFILCLSAISCNSKREGNVAKAELTELVTVYYNALAEKNEQKLKEITAENFVLFDNGQIYNNESSLKMVRELPPFKASFKLDSANSHIGKNDASMYYLREASFTMADSTYPVVKFLESATFLKVEDKWKIRFIHSTLRQ